MGYLRARRSVKLGPGLKMNVTKRGMSMTVGTRGAHYTASTTGRRTSTVGIPGSGISYVDSHGGSRGSSGGKRTAAPAPSEPRPSIKVKRPGLFASASEKRFAAGVRPTSGVRRTLRSRSSASPPTATTGIGRVPTTSCVGSSI